MLVDIIGVDGGDQTGSGCGVVVQLVHVGMQVGQTGGDATAGITAANPATGILRVDTRGVHQGLLDLW